MHPDRGPAEIEAIGSGRGCALSNSSHHQSLSQTSAAIHYRTAAVDMPLSAPYFCQQPSVQLPQILQTNRPSAGQRSHGENSSRDRESSSCRRRLSQACTPDSTPMPVGPLGSISLWEKRPSADLVGRDGQRGKAFFSPVRNRSGQTAQRNVTAPPQHVKRRCSYSISPRGPSQDRQSAATMHNGRAITDLDTFRFSQSCASVTRANVPKMPPFSHSVISPRPLAENSALCGCQGSFESNVATPQKSFTQGSRRASVVPAVSGYFSAGVAATTGGSGNVTSRRASFAVGPARSQTYSIDLMGGSLRTSLQGDGGMAAAAAIPHSLAERETIPEESPQAVASPAVGLASTSRPEKEPLAAGDYLPRTRILLRGQGIHLRDFFTDRRGVLFGGPGAFTPTCSERHIVGFRDDAAKIRACGIDFIACIYANDPYVLKAWARSRKIQDQFTFISDVEGRLASALGVLGKIHIRGLGIRPRRFAMIIGYGGVLEWSRADADCFSEDVLAFLESSPIGTWREPPPPPAEDPKTTAAASEEHSLMMGTLHNGNVLTSSTASSTEDHVPEPRQGAASALTDVRVPETGPAQSLSSAPSSSMDLNASDLDDSDEDDNDCEDRPQVDESPNEFSSQQILVGTCRALMLDASVRVDNLAKVPSLVTYTLGSGNVDSNTIAMTYNAHPRTHTVTNTANCLRVAVDISHGVEGFGSVRYHGRKYVAHEFQIVGPSPHTIDPDPGFSRPLELRIVHQAQPNQQTERCDSFVIAVTFKPPPLTAPERDNVLAANSFLHQILEIPTLDPEIYEVFQVGQRALPAGGFRLHDLFPSSAQFLQYRGVLSGLNERVNWMVMREPLSCSRNQQRKLEQFLSCTGRTCESAADAFALVHVYRFLPKLKSIRAATGALLVEALRKKFYTMIRLERHLFTALFNALSEQSFNQDEINAWLFTFAHSLREKRDSWDDLHSLINRTLENFPISPEEVRAICEAACPSDGIKSRYLRDFLTDEDINRLAEGLRTASIVEGDCAGSSPMARIDFDHSQIPVKDSVTRMPDSPRSLTNSEKSFLRSSTAPPDVLDAAIHKRAWGGSNNGYDDGSTINSGPSSQSMDEPPHFGKAKAGFVSLGAAKEIGADGRVATDRAVGQSIHSKSSSRHNNSKNGGAREGLNTESKKDVSTTPSSKSGRRNTTAATGVSSSGGKVPKAKSNYISKGITSSFQASAKNTGKLRFDEGNKETEPLPSAKLVSRSTDISANTKEGGAVGNKRHSVKIAADLVSVSTSRSASKEKERSAALPPALKHRDGIRECHRKPDDDLESSRLSRCSAALSLTSKFSDGLTSKRHRHGNIRDGHGHNHVLRAASAVISASSSTGSDQVDTDSEASNTSSDKVKIYSNNPDASVCRRLSQESVPGVHSGDHLRLCSTHPGSNGSSGVKSFLSHTPLTTSVIEDQYTSVPDFNCNPGGRRTPESSSNRQPPPMRGNFSVPRPKHLSLVSGQGKIARTTPSSRTRSDSEDSVGRPTVTVRRGSDLVMSKTRCRPDDTGGIALAPIQSSRSLGREKSASTGRIQEGSPVGQTGELVRIGSKEQKRTEYIETCKSESAGTGSDISESTGDCGAGSAKLTGNADAVGARSGDRRVAGVAKKFKKSETLESGGGDVGRQSDESRVPQLETSSFITRISEADECETESSTSSSKDFSNAAAEKKGTSSSDSEDDIEDRTPERACKANSRASGPSPYPSSRKADVDSEDQYLESIPKPYRVKKHNCCLFRRAVSSGGFAAFEEVLRCHQERAAIFGTSRSNPGSSGSTSTSRPGSSSSGRQSSRSEVSSASEEDDDDSFSSYSSGDNNRTSHDEFTKSESSQDDKAYSEKVMGLKSTKRAAVPTASRPALKGALKKQAYIVVQPVTKTDAPRADSLQRQGLVKGGLKNGSSTAIKPKARVKPPQFTERGSTSSEETEAEESTEEMESSSATESDRQSTDIASSQQLGSELDDAESSSSGELRDSTDESSTEESFRHREARSRGPAGHRSKDPDTGRSGTSAKAKLPPPPKRPALRLPRVQEGGPVQPPAAAGTSGKTTSRAGSKPVAAQRQTSSEELLKGPVVTTEASKFLTEERVELVNFMLQQLKRSSSAESADDITTANTAANMKCGKITAVELKELNKRLAKELQAKRKRAAQNSVCQGIRFRVSDSSPRGPPDVASDTWSNAERKINREDRLRKRKPTGHPNLGEQVAKMLTQLAAESRVGQVRSDSRDSGSPKYSPNPSAQPLKGAMKRPQGSGRPSLIRCGSSTESSDSRVQIVRAYGGRNLNARNLDEPATGVDEIEETSAVETSESSVEDEVRSVSSGVESEDPEPESEEDDPQRRRGHSSNKNSQTRVRQLSHFVQRRQFPPVDEDDNVEGESSNVTSSCTASGSDDDTDSTYSKQHVVPPRRHQDKMGPKGGWRQTRGRLDSDGEEAKPAKHRKTWIQVPRTVESPSQDQATDNDNGPESSSSGEAGHSRDGSRNNAQLPNRGRAPMANGPGHSRRHMLAAEELSPMNARANGSKQRQQPGVRLAVQPPSRTSEEKSESSHDHDDTEKEGSRSDASGGSSEEETQLSVQSDGAAAATVTTTPSSSCDEGYDHEASARHAGKRDFYSVNSRRYDQGANVSPPSHKKGHGNPVARRQLQRLSRDGSSSSSASPVRQTSRISSKSSDGGGAIIMATNASGPRKKLSVMQYQRDQPKTQYSEVKGIGELAERGKRQPKSTHHRSPEEDHPVEDRTTIAPSWTAKASAQPVSTKKSKEAASTLKRLGDGSKSSSTARGGREPTVSGRSMFQTTEKKSPSDGVCSFAAVKPVLRPFANQEQSRHEMVRYVIARGSNFKDQGMNTGSTTIGSAPGLAPRQLSATAEPVKSARATNILKHPMGARKADRLLGVPEVVKVAAKIADERIPPKQLSGGTKNLQSPAFSKPSRQPPSLSSSIAPSVSTRLPKVVGSVTDNALPECETSSDSSDPTVDCSTLPMHLQAKDLQSVANRRDMAEHTGHGLSHGMEARPCPENPRPLLLGPTPARAMAASSDAMALSASNIDGHSRLPVGLSDSRHGQEILAGTAGTTRATSHSDSPADLIADCGDSSSIRLLEQRLHNDTSLGAGESRCLVTRQLKQNTTTARIFSNSENDNNLLDMCLPERARLTTEIAEDLHPVSASRPSPTVSTTAVAPVEIPQRQLFAAAVAGDRLVPLLKTGSPESLPGTMAPSNKPSRESKGKKGTKSPRKENASEFGRMRGRMASMKTPGLIAKSISHLHVELGLI